MQTMTSRSHPPIMSRISSGNSCLAGGRLAFRIFFPVAIITSSNASSRSWADPHSSQTSMFDCRSAADRVYTWGTDRQAELAADIPGPQQVLFLAHLHPFHLLLDIFNLFCTTSLIICQRNYSVIHSPRGAS